MIVVDWHTGLAIGGYDPVAFYTDGKPVPGKVELELTYGGAVWRFCNIGNHEAVGLETFIATLAGLLGRPAIKEYAPMQPGDVPVTYAAIDRLNALTGFSPSMPLADGLARFVAWYRDYFEVAV